MLRLTKATKLQQRFNANITPEPYSGCWLWTGCCDRYGYGIIGVGAREKILVHRLAYSEYHRIELDKLAGLDHSCRVRSCVNPLHLRIANQRQNRANSRVQSNNKLGLKGVSWNKNHNRYRAQICGQNIGWFDNPIDASRAYQKEAQKMFGEFACFD